jgi:transcription initiation factor IIE alpha subunit
MTVQKTAPNDWDSTIKKNGFNLPKEKTSKSWIQERLGWMMVYWIPSLSQVGGVILVRVNHPVKNASKHGGCGKDLNMFFQ